MQVWESLALNESIGKKVGARKLTRAREIITSADTSMTSILHKLDGAVLAWCTRLAHSVQRATGISNFLIARAGVAFTALSVLADVGNYFLHFSKHSTSFAFLCFDGLILFSLILNSAACTRSHDQLFTSAELSISQSLVSSPFWSLLWFLVFLLDSGQVAWEHPAHLLLLEIVRNPCFSFGQALFFYFASVHPLPPSKSKIRQFVDSLGRRLIPCRAES